MTTTCVGEGIPWGITRPYDEPKEPWWPTVPLRFHEKTPKGIEANSMSKINHPVLVVSILDELDHYGYNVFEAYSIIINFPTDSLLQSLERACNSYGAIDDELRGVLMSAIENDGDMEICEKYGTEVLDGADNDFCGTVYCLKSRLEVSYYDEDDDYE